jgi:hypothetical protein
MLQSEIASTPIGVDPDREKATLHAMETVISFVEARRAGGVRIACRADAEFVQTCSRMHRVVLPTVRIVINLPNRRDTYADR